MTKTQLNNTEYIWAHSYNVFQIWKKFKEKLIDGYPWMLGDPPKIFKNVLITPIVHEKTLNTILEELAFLRSTGDHSFLMFDSGGFQVNNSANNITQANIVERNLYLYNIYDNADAYVLADVGLGSSTIPIHIQKERIMQTITLTKKLYERLPERIQVKSVPVYQVGRKEHIDMQFESHSKISEHSGMACYSIPPPKKLTFEHMKWIMYLKSLQPNTKIHLLGSSSPPSFFAMQRIGVDSCDSITPIWQGGNGAVASYIAEHTFSEKRSVKSLNKTELQAIQKRTGHRCPFCDENNLDRLQNYFIDKMVHNLIVFSEVNQYYQQFNIEQYKNFSEITEKWAVTLEKALDSSVSIPETVETATAGNNTTVDNNMPKQLTLF